MVLDNTSAFYSGFEIELIIMEGQRETNMEHDIEAGMPEGFGALGSR